MTGKLLERIDMQTEFKIVVWQPTDKWCADVYVDGKREMCGRGCVLRSRAMYEAIRWLETTYFEEK